MLEDLRRAVAILRTGRHKHPIKIRMHPLDMNAMARKYGGDPNAVIEKIAGAPVEMDCAVPRGRPVAEYDE